MATTTTHVNFIPEIWANSALAAFRKYIVAASLVPRIADNEFGRLGSVFHIPSIADLSVGTRSEGAAMTFEDGSSTQITVALNQWDYAAFKVTDLLNIQANQDLMGMYVNNAMQVLAEKVDARILALYASAGAVVGAGATAWTATTMLNLDKAFNDNSVPMDGRVLIMGTKGRLEYLTFTSQNGINSVHPGAGQAAEAAEMVNVYGFRPFLDNQVVSTAGPPLTYHNMAFHPSALAMASRPLQLPDANQGVDGGYAAMDNISLRVLRSFDHATTTNRISVDILYGLKVLRPTALFDVQD